MSDILSKIFGYFVGIVLMFLLPVMIMLINLDNEVEKYVNDAVVEFVDKSRATGYISPDNYEKLVDKIGNTGNNYEVNLCHESLYAFPEAGGTYSNHYYSYYRNEILEAMYPATGDAKAWNLKSGDYIRVTVSLKESTYGGKLFSLFSGADTGGSSMTYGGYVGNNTK